jgi:hypothetical protein
VANKKFVVKLSSEERKRLSELISKGKSAAKIVLKARILLKAINRKRVKAGRMKEFARHSIPNVAMVTRRRDRDNAAQQISQVPGVAQVSLGGEQRPCPRNAQDWPPARPPHRRFRVPSCANFRRFHPAPDDDPCSHGSGWPIGGAPRSASPEPAAILRRGAEPSPTTKSAAEEAPLGRNLPRGRGAALAGVSAMPL